MAALTRKETTVSAQSSSALPVAEVARAETHPMSRTVTLSGALKSGDEASLSPKQGGKIAAVLVRQGDRVRKGQVLVRLDAFDAQRQADQAAAGAAAARANWQKALDGERLKRTDVQRRIDDARRGVQQAKLQLEKALAGVRLQNGAAPADVQKAQAGVDAAKSALDQARRGARPQQRRQSEIQVREAERGSRPRAGTWTTSATLLEGRRAAYPARPGARGLSEGAGRLGAGPGAARPAERRRLSGGDRGGGSAGAERAGGADGSACGVAAAGRGQRGHGGGPPAGAPGGGRPRAAQAGRDELAVAAERGPRRPRRLRPGAVRGGAGLGPGRRDGAHQPGGRDRQQRLARTSARWRDRARRW